MSNDAADAPSFRCPVCRARQALRDACRRCEADLRLVARAHRRVHYVTSRLQEACASGDRRGEQILAEELRRLAPKRVK